MNCGDCRHTTEAPKMRKELEELRAKVLALEEANAKALRLHHAMCDVRDYGIERRDSAESKLAKAREAWSHSSMMCVEPECTYEATEIEPPEYGPSGKCWACILGQALAKDLAEEERDRQHLRAEAERLIEEGGF